MDTVTARLLFEECEELRIKLIALKDLVSEQCEPSEFETIQRELDRAWTVIEDNLYPYLEFERPGSSRTRRSKKKSTSVSS